MFSIALSRWITNLVEISSKDWPRLEHGVALMNSIESLLKFYRLLLYKSKAFKMLSEKRKTFLISWVKKYL